MRRLADEAGVIVVSTEYRLAPENPYPGSWNDAEDAFDWAVANADRLAGDKSRICVGGDSAGGNMAVVVTARAQKADKHSRSEEHTSELQSLMRNSYAVFCLKKKKIKKKSTDNQ